MNDNFIITASNVESLLDKIKDKIEGGGGGDTGFDFVINNGVVKNVYFQLKIPEGVTDIGNEAFDNQPSLTSVIIPDGVKTIGSRAFQGCTNLTEVTIPSGVTEIGNYAFRNCTKLNTIKIPSSVRIIYSEAFSYIDNNATIYCGFSEGAVSGAPWGAPNTVTIVYDSIWS